MRVLVVDDDVQIRTLLRTFLTRHGHEVVVADSADRALALDIDAAPLDAALIDVGLPGAMTGVELAHHLAARQPSLPIVLMSGHLNDPDRIGVPPPGTRYLEKPFTPSVVQKLLREISPR
jgi:DNA-binding response OmpR family regulator